MPGIRKSFVFRMIHTFVITRFTSFVSFQLPGYFNYTLITNLEIIWKQWFQLLRHTMSWSYTDLAITFMAVLFIWFFNLTRSYSYVAYKYLLWGCLVNTFYKTSRTHEIIQMLLLSFQADYTDFFFLWKVWLY